MDRLVAPRTDAEVPGYVRALGVPGIIDLHVHFMPDRMQQKVWGFFDRLPERGEREWPITYRGGDDERVRTLRGLGVKGYTTLNYAHRPGVAQWLNDYSTGFAESHPDAIHSATFYPEPGVISMVEQSLERGARVFKVHIQVGDFSPLDPQLEQVWSVIAAAGVPVVIHCGSGPHGGTHTGPEPIRELLRRHPDLALVIAHAGLPEYSEFADLALRHPNVYLDTTMVGTSYTEKFSPLPHDYPATLARLGDKVVLGTDFPTIPYQYAHQIEVLHEWGLGAEWMGNVLWHTPRHVLGLTETPRGAAQP